MTSDPFEQFRSREILNLGCGSKKMPEAVNVDSQASIGPDLVVDLNTRPWPLPTNHFREVRAFDVIEHLENVIGAMEELHRVCKPGATVHITVPHYSCANAFTDPTHRHYFGAGSFHYLTGEHDHNHYTDVRFRRIGVQIVFHRTLTNKIVHRVANAWPMAYERR